MNKTTAICDVCGKDSLLEELEHVPGIGYMHNADNPDCKLNVKDYLRKSKKLEKPHDAILKELAIERVRQIEVEGYTPEKDDKYLTNELAKAAAAYALATPGGGMPAFWPWHYSWWKPTTVRRNLIKAAALLIAEIERLDRLPKQNP